MDIKFECLKGKTLSSIKGGVGDEEMVFKTIDGETFKLYYDHD